MIFLYFKGGNEISLVNLDNFFLFFLMLVSCYVESNEVYRKEVSFVLVVCDIWE